MNRNEDTPRKRRHDNVRRTSNLVLIAITVLAFAAPALAHPRPWRHSHRRTVHVHHRPVIVFGPARPVRHVVHVHGRPGAVVDFNVKPKKTAIYVDGTYRGTVDNFDGYPQKMVLAPGVHRIRLVTPDGTDLTQKVRLQAGTEIDVDLDLR